MAKPYKRKKRILSKISLSEISAVDVPAQEGATAAIMKSRSLAKVDPYKDEELRKRAGLTSAKEGHTHLVHVDMDGAELNNGFTSWEDGHSHPWIRMEDGSIKIGKVDGHSHSLDKISKRTPDSAAPAADEGSSPAGNSNPQLEKKMDEQEIQALKDAAELAKNRADKAEALLALNDAQRAYHKNLSDEDGDVFLAKSEAARQEIVDAELAKAADENAIVYTADNGDEFRKNDDPRVVKMARERDIEKRENQKIRDEAEGVMFEKRAGDELGNAKGELKTKVALLKAVAGIPDTETREAVTEVLKAADGAFALLAKSKGHGGAGAGDDDLNSPQAQLDALANEIAKSEGIPFAKAYTAACDTPKGRELYALQAAAAREAATR